MTPQDLIAAFDTLAEAPDGVTRLRELVLQLAVRGQLVPQDPGDEPASVLLERIAAEKARLVKAKKIRKPKALPPVSADEVRFEVPAGWTWTRLGVTGVTQTGATPKKALLEADGPRIAFVRPSDISWDGVDTQREAVPESAATATGRVVEPPAVLMVCIGTVGKSGVCRERATFNQQINAIAPLLVSPSYVGWAVRSPSFQAACWGAASATTISILNKGKWEALPFPLPPLAEQTRIVARVDELMGLLDTLEAARNAREATRVALRDAALAALRDADTSEAVEAAWARIAGRMDDLFTDPADVEPLRQTVLQLAVRGRLVPQDPADEPASALLARIAAEKARLVKAKKIRKPKALPPVSADEVPFEVPAGWTWAPFGATHINRDAERVPLSRAVRNQRKGAYEYYGASGVIDSLDDFLFDDTLLLIGEDGANLVLRSTPIAFLASGKFWVNNHAHVLDSVDVDSLRYLAMYVNATDLKPFLTGIAQPKLNQKKMNGIPCAFPPLGEQQRIVARVDSLMGLVDELAQHLADKKALHSEFAAAAVHHLDA